LGDAKKDKINPIEELVLLHKDKDSSFRYHYIQNDDLFRHYECNAVK